MNKNIRCVVIKQFILQKFEELENLKRYNSNLSKDGELYINDEFNCSKEMADYLMGGNKDKQVVVKVIEVKPEKKIEERIEDIRNMDVGEPIPKEKFEKIKKEFELKPKKKKSSKK